MEENKVDKLIKAKIILPLGDSKSVYWNTNGVILLENVKKQIRKALNGMHMKELMLPSVFEKKYYPPSLVKEENIVSLDGKKELLVPFSESIYLYLLDNLKKQGKDIEEYKKVFCWTREYINERFHDLSYNSYEIYRYEMFSLVKEAEAVDEWSKFNKTFTKFVEDVFKLKLISGERQGIRRFPKAKRTYSFEMKLEEDLYRTIFVSHILTEDFIHDVGVLNGDSYQLLSSCLSQKAILTIILHHQDELGIRIPSMIAPIIGIIVSDHDRTEESNIKVYALKYQEKVQELMIEECAIWGIVEQQDQVKVIQRIGLEEKCFLNMEDALVYAHQYEKEFDKQLLMDSEEKNSFTICEKEEQLKSHKHIRFIRCCGGKLNRDRVHDYDHYIEKQSIKRGKGRCMFCKKETEDVVMAEYQEDYTSHYRNIEEKTVE